VTISEFLINLKKEFSGGNNKIIKVVELKKVEQRSRMMKEYVQEFRKVIRNSRYEGKPLVEKFKRGMNRMV